MRGRHGGTWRDTPPRLPHPSPPPPSRVILVRNTSLHGHIISIRIHELSAILPIYIGSVECSSLLNELHRNRPARPMTHDLMVETVKLMGFTVERVCITALVGSTYHAAVHYRKRDPVEEEGEEAGAGDDPSSTASTKKDESNHNNKNNQNVDISTGSLIMADARPSDALNLAVRFQAPIYVDRDVAVRMAQAAPDTPESSVDLDEASGDANAGSKDVRKWKATHEWERKERSEALRAREREREDLKKTVTAELQTHEDTTVLTTLQLRLAIEHEDYEKAAQLRDELDKTVRGSRELALLFAMESALLDRRFDEAKQMKAQLEAVREQEKKAKEEREVMGGDSDEREETIRGLAEAGDVMEEDTREKQEYE